MDAPWPVVIPRPVPLLSGELILRYKRFFADIRLDSGEVITAHCVNTGAMEGLTTPGTRVWVSPATNPARKLKYTWELAEIDGRVLGVDTGLPNRIVGRLLKERLLPGLRDWDELAPERKYGDCHRVDFWMRFGDREHYLEVKNCHLVYPDNRAYFPDCVSERATKHLQELVRCVGRPEASAEVLFFVQVPGAECVRPSDAHDPAFAVAAREAAAAGVTFRALTVAHTPEAILVENQVGVDLKPYDLERVLGWKNVADQEKKSRSGKPAK